MFRSFEHGQRRQSLVAGELNSKRLELLHQAVSFSGIEAVNVLTSSNFVPLRQLIIDRLSQAHLPAIYEFPEYAELGGLLCYGPRLLMLYQQVAGLVSKILRGVLPKDLPIEQTSKIEFSVNLKTAKEIGLTIPSSILARADQVIE